MVTTLSGPDAVCSAIVEHVTESPMKSAGLKQRVDDQNHLFKKKISDLIYW